MITKFLHIHLKWRITHLELEDFEEFWILQDGDVLWFRDPFTVLSNDDTVDVQISSDRALEHPIQTYARAPNSGFLYVRSNNRTIAMYKYWYEARLRYPGSNDQTVVTGIFKEGDFRSQVGVKVLYFDPVYFSGFCTVRHLP